MAARTYASITGIRDATRHNRMRNIDKINATINGKKHRMITSQRGNRFSVHTFSVNTECALHAKKDPL
jgi:hypothetical protein